MKFFNQTEYLPNSYFQHTVSNYGIVPMPSKLGTNENL